MNAEKYMWDAGLYQRNSSLQFELGLETLKRLQPGDRETILDIGCGNGLLTIEAARMAAGGEVVALERSPEMLRQAKENMAAAGLSNLSFVNISMLDMDFQDRFDAIFSNSAVHWVNDLERLYRLIFRALKPGGRIMIQTGLRERNETVESVIRILQEEKFREHFENITLPWRFLTTEETRDTLQKAGFSDISIEPYLHAFAFETMEELRGYFEAAPLVPFFDQVPRKMRDELIRSFMDIYLEVNRQELTVKTTRLFISAKK